MLVGRDSELSELGGALSRIGTEGALYLIAGEPGIGKTRLATEATSLARVRGVRVAWGRCWEAGGAPPFWPWREAFDGGGVPFPEASMVAAGDPSEARFALFREIAGALERAAATTPLLLVLEDLHAADQPTLVLLEFVANRLRRHPLVIVGTYRDLEARQRADAGDALARLGRVGRVLPLSPLTAQNVREIVRHAFGDGDPQLASTVYDITHGNPLFVDEMVRDMKVRGAGRGPSVPLGVREVIRHRLGRVSETVRPVLDAASVLGVESAVAVLARLAGPVDATLDEAQRSGLVTVREGRIRFSHSLYREGLYHDISRLRRQSLHRDAANALSASGASPGEVAHHLLESGADNAALAIEQTVRAAASAVDVFAFEEAAALLHRASQAIPKGPLESALRPRVLMAQGEAQIRSGDATGRELCAQAAALARAAGDAELLARAGLAYGSVFMTGGVDPFLVGVLEEALHRLPEADTALRARVMARFAAARQPSAPEDRPRDILLVKDAVAMARRVGDRRELLAVLHSASGVIYGALDPAERMPLMREQERLAEELGDTARLLTARVRLAIDYLELGDFASYETLASSYEALAQRIGPAAEPWRVPLMRSMLALREDRFEDSLRFQEESKLRDSERPRARRAQAFHRICFFRAAERHAELRASIPELRNLWLAMPYGGVLADARVASVLARVGAVEELADLLARLPETVWAEEINAPHLGEAVWATRDRARARQLLALAAPYRTRRWLMYWFDCEIVEAPLLRVFSYLEGIAGNWEECERQFEQSLHTVEAVGRRSMAARMRFELGDLLAREGRESARARRLITEARALAGEVGLPDLVALIDRRHPGISQREGVGETQPRPSTVARVFKMVAEGEYFAVETPRGVLRFKANRGMQYLALLVSAPDVAFHVLELAGSSEHPDRGDAGELLDASAIRAYRERLEALKETREDAEALGDTDRAEQARDEMETIARDLGRATGPGGRVRRAESAVDRARSAVQRRLKDAISRIGEQDPSLGTWLQRCVQTGNYCSFRPQD